MPRTVGIGIQNFEQIITNNYFYIDKTNFIKEWWESGDHVTLITRPRRFGKTLTMSMLERFFSVSFHGQGNLFSGLAIWENQKYIDLQGTYPVINVSFANVKEKNYENAKKKMNEILVDLYVKNIFLKNSSLLTDKEIAYFDRISVDMDDSTASLALHRLSDFLCHYYGKKVIILLDEYDTPMLEAYVRGYWEELVDYTRNLFHSTFKTNPYMERGMMTGITRISKESIFSDLNNLEVVTSTSAKYAESFGFSETEVFDALDEYGMSDQKEKVKYWYDGFTFGGKSDIYNPWSVVNFLDKGNFSSYWANTSSNSLPAKMIREGSSEVKMVMEDLLKGGSFCTEIDEQIVFNQLDRKKSAIWSFLLASGYLKVEKYSFDETTERPIYELKLTNREVKFMFENMIRDWFSEYTEDYNDFIKALLAGNLKAMNTYMNHVALDTFSFFDTGKKPSRTSEPERFYHGFVLGLMVDLTGRYEITSNRESGFGRYDVLLTPKKQGDHAYILEFKVKDPDEEETLKQTVASALAQIEEKQYETVLRSQGIPADKIKKYGFAFEGKKVLIG